MDILPDEVIEKLILAGAPVREEDGKQVIELLEPQHIAVYTAYLKAESDAEVAALTRNTQTSSEDHFIEFG